MPFLFNASEKNESLEFLVELLEQPGTQQKPTIPIQLNSERNLYMNTRLNVLLQLTRNHFDRKFYLSISE